MVTALGVLRRVWPTPSVRDVRFAVRGFPTGNAGMVRRLEGVSEAVVSGFEIAADRAEQDAIVRKLSEIEPFYRGLAYEGAVAALMLKDILRPGQGERAARFIRGPGAPHAFLSYIGYGFLMSRLPRALWARQLPVVDSPPVMSRLTWLAVDGYAFDRAYFDTHRWVTQRHRPKPYPWKGDSEYFARVFDQGIGRALWFVHVADCRAVVEAIATFEEGRRADLWSGVGAAAAYVGGPERDELRWLHEQAGPYRPELALGAILGITSRHRGVYVPECARLSSQVLCGLSVDDAVRLADETLSVPSSGAAPEYEQWRVLLRQHFEGLAEQPTT